MTSLSKELLRIYFKNQNLSITHSGFETLKYITQESLEVEIDEELVYGKYDYSKRKTGNSRNGYSKKFIKTELGLVVIKLVRNRKVKFQSKIIENIREVPINLKIKHYIHM